MPTSANCPAPSVCFLCRYLCSAAMGSGEQARKRVSFNQESEICNIKSLLRRFSSVKKVTGSMTTVGTMQCALCN
jgi:hypothetical protein